MKWIKKLTAAAVLLGLFLGLSACAALEVPQGEVPQGEVPQDEVPQDELPSEPLTPPPDITPPPAVETEPTLLNRYALLRDDNRKDYLSLLYRPRQFPHAPYSGWDVLELPSGHYRSYKNRDWLILGLNRAAQVAVVWDGAEPGSWLADWTPGPDILGKQSFVKTFAAGEVRLGAIGGTINHGYNVLLAEVDGEPSQPPPVPDGLDVPVPNKLCPGWVHDQYLTRADDGRVYRTWHQTIDPVYWCYFGHEHGADPSLLPSGYEAPYGYTAYYNNLQNEHHNGFKGFYFERGGLHWYMSIHFTTGLAGRVCARFHTAEIRAEEPSGELVVWLRHKADFGETRVSGSSYLDPSQINEARPATTDACETSNVELAALNTVAQKKLRGEENKGYETWRMDDTYSAKLFGLHVRGLTFDTLNPQTRCVDLECAEVVATGSDGTGRAVDFLSGFGLTWQDIPAETRAVIEKGKGYFYTDQYGNELRTFQDTSLKDSLARNAILQFIRPGTVISLGGPPKRQNCHALEPWRGKGGCGDERFSVHFGLEQAVQGVN